MPTVYRPRAVLWTGVAASVLLVGAALLGWLLLPAQVRALFTGAQVATLLLFLLVTVGLMLSLGASRVSAAADGLVVRNGWRTHQLPWSEIAGFRFTADDPWAYVLLSDDPGSRPMMALQRVDGDRARAAVAVLEGLWISYRDAA